MHVIEQERKSAVLSPSNMPCISRIPTVNFTVGCGHRCVYCYARSYSSFPGDDTVIVYTNTFKKLRSELPRKRVKPALVYFSPSTDPFQPIKPVLDMAYDCFEHLLKAGIAVAFLTKGRIPERHMELLTRHGAHVQAMFDLSTVDQRLLDIFEPGTAAVAERLGYIRRFVESGAIVEVRLDPILPGVTDGEAELEATFSAIAAAGAQRAAINVLYLRPALARSIRMHVAEPALREKVLAYYRPGVRLKVCDNKYSQVAPDAEVRRRIYARARQIAERHHVATRICGCMNPDVATGKCLLAEGLENLPEAREAQMDLCFG
jgi:DNA repair photolyase